MEIETNRINVNISAGGFLKADYYKNLQRGHLKEKIFMCHNM